MPIRSDIMSKGPPDILPRDALLDLGVGGDVGRIIPTGETVVECRLECREDQQNEQAGKQEYFCLAPPKIIRVHFKQRSMRDIRSPSEALIFQSIVKLLFPEPGLTGVCSAQE